jgi:transposase InsO family protein
VSAYRFIAAERARFPVALMCEVLGVSRSGFYDWCRRPPSRRAIDDRTLTRRIVEIHRDSRGAYGAPRITAELRAGGLRISRKRVARLMRAARLEGRHLRRPPTARRKAFRRPVPDLVGRRFDPGALDRVWASDITYVATAQGWLYLAVVMDLHSRRIVGWATAEHLRAELPLGALEMALAHRRPARGLIHHSDHGTQFLSLEFAARTQRGGIVLSMGANGSAYDNAVVESFFATIKRERLGEERFLTRVHAHRAIGEWIEVFYNRRRRHSSLGYLSPLEFERSRRITRTNQRVR